MFRCLILTLGLSLVGMEPGFADEVVGYGQNSDDAKVDARRHVLKRLKERLAAHEPPFVAWQPTLADVETMIEGPGRAGRAWEVDGVVQERWILPVRFPTDAELSLRDRRARRQFEAALAALAAISGAGAWWTISRWHGERRA